MITYTHQRDITTDEFIDVLKRSTLAERRPVNNKKRIEAMLKHANLTVTAWDGEKLVGISRALTDYSFCCYLSDLAVDESYQKQGIGKKLIEETHKIAGYESMLILLAAPAAINYYGHIGMEKINNGFIINTTSLTE